MKTLLKTITLCTLLLIAAPSFAGVRFGLDIRFGAPPPPREVICPAPFTGAIWYPGFYNHIGYRYIWVPGRWDHRREFEGRREERFEHRDWDRDNRFHEDFHRGEHGEGRAR